MLERGTLWYRWLDAVALVDKWQREARGGKTASSPERDPNVERPAGSTPKRRTLSFCGFTPTHHQPVSEFRLPSSVHRCSTNLSEAPSDATHRLPLRSLKGFRDFFGAVSFHSTDGIGLAEPFSRVPSFSTTAFRPPLESIFYSPRFGGFLTMPRRPQRPPPSAGSRGAIQKCVSCGSADGVESGRRFQGFLGSAQSAHAPSEAIFRSFRFNGFMNDAPPCVASATVTGLPNNRRP